LSQWITDSIQKIRDSTSIARNSWRHGAYSYFPNEATVEAQHQEDLRGEQEAESEEEHSDMVVGEEDSSSGEDEQQEVIRPQRQEAPRQQEAPWRDPGWDDTSDSNYELPSGDSSS
jgi:hypothetical protein